MTTLVSSPTFDDFDPTQNFQKFLCNVHLLGTPIARKPIPSCLSIIIKATTLINHLCSFFFFFIIVEGAICNMAGASKN